MSKKTRLIILSFLALLFIICAPLVVLYSQGYRFDFEKKKIVQTGGLNIKAVPIGSEVKINDELAGKTSFLFRYVFVQNLLPQKYKVSVEKENYFSWEKTLEIKEKEITKAENIILFPKTINLFLLEKEAQNFYLSPDKKQAVIEKNIEGFGLKLINLEKTTHDYILRRKDKSARLSDLIWSNDSKKILLNLIINDKSERFIYNLEEKNLEELNLEEEAENVLFDPANSDLLFFQENKKVFRKNLKTLEQEKVFENVLSFNVFNGYVFWLSGQGLLIKSDINGEIIEIINKKPQPINQKAKYTIKPFIGNDVLLLENNTIFGLNKREHVFEKIFDGIQEFQISPDGKNAVFCSDYEIWLFNLGAKKTFLNRFSDKIESCSWLNFNYLILKIEGQVKIIETDTRDKINSYDLRFEKFDGESLETKDLKFFFRQDNRKIYLLTNKNLYFSIPLF